MSKSMHNLWNTLQSFECGGAQRHYYSISALEEQRIGPVSRLPVSLRIVLESLLRNYDDQQISEQDVENLANWDAKTPNPVEIPFKPARVIAQDFTGVPLLVDLAAMRSAVDELNGNPQIIEPVIPVDLVIDHSVQVDAYRSENALKINTRIEFERNKERYEFLKWGQGAFNSFKIVPPSIGIVHQVNLEYLAQLVVASDVNGSAMAYPDTLVGTDSHTTMINGLGIVGWGVGGIEAEAAMLGQPVYILTPEVVGVNLSGSLNEGVTATDLVLTVTQRLRETKVVGKFVEFFGDGVEALSLPDRATISNMCPEYGATIGFFPPDDETMRYLKQTGRGGSQVELVEEYLKRQQLFGIPKSGDIEFSSELTIDLDGIEPSISGPKRPQDRIVISKSQRYLLQSLETADYRWRLRTVCIGSPSASKRSQSSRANYARFRCHCRHHELHQHQQSVRDDCSGTTGEESRRARSPRSRLCQNQPRSRFAGCHRVSAPVRIAPLS